MHDSDRGDHTKTGLIAGIVVAALIAAAFIGWGLWHSAQYEREASDHAREYAAYANEQIRQSCLSLAPVDQQQCTAKARHEQRDNERNERDLVAQRQSALWAYIMGAAAVIGMGLSVIGVFLVWTTFDATRKANVIAHDALDGQLRPWVSFRVEYFGGKIEGDTITVKLQICMKNRGTSPAVHLTYAVGMYVEEMHGERAFNLMPSYFEDETSHHDKTIFPGDEWDKDCTVVCANAPKGPHPIVVIIAVRYRSTYAKTNRYTCKVFDLEGRGPGRLIDIQPNTSLDQAHLELRDDVGYIAT